MLVASKFIKFLIHKRHKINGLNALVLGINFKENCSDIRNSRVIDIITELKQFGVIVDVYDPYAKAESLNEEYNINLIPNLS